MWNWLFHPFKAYRARCRKIDIEVLWPSLKEQNSENAKIAMLIHCCFSKAWIYDFPSYLLIYEELEKRCK